MYTRYGDEELAENHIAFQRDRIRTLEAQRDELLVLIGAAVQYLNTDNSEPARYWRADAITAIDKAESNDDPSV